MNQKGFSPLFIILGIILVIGIAGGAYYLGRQNIFKSQSQNPMVTTKPISTPSVQPTPTNASLSAIIDTSNWKKFTSKTEGFTLLYPPEWIIEDSSSGNCAHTKLNGSDCRDRFAFKSPDNLLVSYTIHQDDNIDQYGCGVQSPCDSQDIKSLKTLNISTLGSVYLVSYISHLGGDINHIALHKPVDSRTIPILGENKHSDYEIDFSLPSKTGGRFTLRAWTNTANNQNSKWTGMTYEKFINSDSAQKAILILKSLNY